jgi:hypothetical protein
MSAATINLLLAGKFPQITQHIWSLDITKAYHLHCRRLDGGCLQFGNVDSPLLLELLEQIRLFHTQLRRDKQPHGDIFV